MIHGIKVGAAPSSMYRKPKAVRIWGPCLLPFRCESREGTLDGEPGDYFAEDGHGGHYPISAEFMADNYEEILS